MLCNDINFEPNAVQPCCDVRAIEVPRFDFSGGALDMTAYGAHIQEVVERLQQGGDLCRDCPQLEEIEVPQGASPAARLAFRTVSINMHRHLCNCKCVYCDLWKGGSKGYPILPALKSLAAQGVLHKDCLFSWGGGEPSILPDFEEASLWIMRNGWQQYVHTGALRFSPAVAALLRASQGGVNISLDSGTPETYRAIKGVDGFERVVSSLERYRATCEDPTRIHLKYIVFEKNNSVKEIERFFALCRSLDIRSVQFSLNFLELRDGRPSPKTMLGAAYFVHRALSLGLRCEPFFIDEPWLEEIFALARQHFFGADPDIRPAPPSPDAANP